MRTSALGEAHLQGYVLYPHFRWCKLWIKNNFAEHKSESIHRQENSRQSSSVRNVASSKASDISLDDCGVNLGNRISMGNVYEAYPIVFNAAFHG